MDSVELQMKVEAEVERYCVDRAVGHILGQKPTFTHLSETVVGIALRYDQLGKIEIDTSNTGYLIDKWHRELGLKTGLSWCVIWAQHVLRRASLVYGMPDIWPYNTPGSQAAYKHAEKEGLATIVVNHATPGSLVVLRNGRTNLGHMEILVKTGPVRYDSIGGNTNEEFSRQGGSITYHANVAWSQYGPVGVSHPTKRSTRGIILLQKLYEKW